MTDLAKKILFITVAVLLLALFSAALYKAGKERAVPEEQPELSLETPEPLEKSSVPTESAETVARRATVKFAMQFAERFGSYSNHGNFANLRDLEPIMSASLRDQFLVRLTKSGAEKTQEYYAVTTTAISGELSSYSDQTAEVIVSTLRRENKDTTEAREFQQNLKLNLVKSKERWSVNAALWETL